MPGRGLETSTEYRYDYQGQLKDAETGKNDFYFRQYDAALARWSDTDPYDQYSSPYESMGNAHTVATDPSGGFTFDPSDPNAGGDKIDPIQAYNERKLYLAGQQMAIQNAQGNFYNNVSGANSNNPLYSINNSANFTFYNAGKGFHPQVIQNGVKGYMERGTNQSQSIFPSNPNVAYAGAPYQEERFVPVSGGSKSSDNDVSQGSNWATVTLGFIASDVAILEPTDAAWPKWVAYGIAGTAATVYLHYHFTGYGNSKDWTYTHQLPSQNPIQNPPRGGNSEGGDPNPDPYGQFKSVVKWTGIGLGGAAAFNEYKDHIGLLFSNRPQAAPRDNTTVVSPHKP